MFYSFPFQEQADYPAAEPYIHEEIIAEPYVHEEILAEPYVHEDIPAEPYVHEEQVADGVYSPYSFDFQSQEDGSARCDIHQETSIALVLRVHIGSLSKPDCTGILHLEMTFCESRIFDYYLILLSLASTLEKLT